MTVLQSPVAGSDVSGQFSNRSFLFWALLASAILHLVLLLLPDGRLREAGKMPSKYRISSLTLSLPSAHGLSAENARAVRGRQRLERDSVVRHVPFSENLATYFSPHELDQLAEFDTGRVDLDFDLEEDAVPTTPLRMVLFIGADGAVDNVAVVSDSEFGLRAAEKIRHWRFFPAIRNGQAVPSLKILELMLDVSIGFSD